MLVPVEGVEVGALGQELGAVSLVHWERDTYLEPVRRHDEGINDVESPLRPPRHVILPSLLTLGS